MSDRWPGGIISPAAPTPTGGGAGDSASGIWTIEQAAPYIVNQEWPGTGTPDPQFQYVTALLHGDGANGGQNNTFLDSSSNNFTITRNGNTTQGSFSPYGNLWSNFFTGSSDIYTTTALAAVGTNAFTFEAWINMSNPGTNNTIFCQFNGGNGGLTFSFNNGQLLISRRGVGDDLVAAVTIPANTWAHVAFTRSGTGTNQTAIFLNGSRVALGTVAANYPNGNYYIGSVGGSVYFNGYISNARMVVGSTVYSPSNTTITVPTSPLTAVTNTILLTCQSNRFRDNSSNSYAISITGTPSVQRFSPFQNLATYQPATVGGSGYFDGSGDWLSVANNTALNIGTSDFQVSAWVYPTAAFITSNAIFAKGTNNLGIDITSAGAIRVAQYGVAVRVTSSVNITLNQWSYIVVSRVSNVTKIFLNGVEVGSASDTSNYTSTTSLGIGQDPLDNTQKWTGYITDVRLVNGAGVTSVTVPTVPITAITNTSLLCNFTNAAIVDSDASNDFETVGNAQISTSVVKYGTGSMYFDGNGDYLYQPYSPNMDLLPGSFTIEGWVYPTSFSSDKRIFCTGGGAAAWNSTNGIHVLLQTKGTTGALELQIASGTSTPRSLTTTATLSLNTWSYISASYNASGSVISLSINGLITSSSVSAPSRPSTNPVLAIGIIPGDYAATANYFSGYIDDLRVTKGYVRYWYNFQPPTKALPNYGGTLIEESDPLFEYNTLLLSGNGTNGAQNNTFVDSSTNNFTITRNGNTTQGSFSPYGTLWSNYFDGNDYLTLPSNSALTLNGDFTVEFWVYLSSLSGSPTFWSAVNQTIEVAGSNWIFYNGTTSRTIGTAAANSWQHIAISRTGSTLETYLNGVRGVSVTDTTTLNFSGSSLGYRTLAPAGNYITGYLSNVRFVKGTGVYTGATITVPTSPLTAITNTSLLTCQSNRFVDNSSNAFSITANGNPSVQRFSPFEPTAPYSTSVIGGSGYFDGSGDYLLAATGSSGAPGTGDFCAEAFFYRTAASSDNNIMTNIVSSGDGDTAWGIGASGIGNLVYFTTWNTTVLSATVPPVNTWNHLVACRSGTTLSLFLNGSRVATTTNSMNFSSTNDIRIGAYGSGFQPFNGYISNARFVKGSSVYNPASTTITVPTAPLTAITNTQLLTNFTNAGISDLAMQNNLETVGNAQVSTAQSKFGGSSLAFDGSGDILFTRYNPNLNISSGDFTIEGWVNFSTATQYFHVVSMWDSGNLMYQLLIETASRFVNFNTSSNGSSSTGDLQSANGSVSANTWTHIAVTRNGSTIRLFINGNLIGSNTATIFNGASNLAIGGRADGSFYGTGYIQDLRITKGIARYVQPFTPPTQAFQTY